jgi:O-antigen ligase
MATTLSAPTRPTRSLDLSAFAFLLWACLWCNLNSGFWDLVSPNSLDSLQLLVRAVLPFGVLPIAAIFLIARKTLRLPRRSPSRMLFLYGAFATLASVFSPEPMWALYWSVVFLATLLAAWAFIDRADPIDSVRQLLLITWIATLVVAAIVGYAARNSVFGSSATGYGVNAELHDLSRAAGVARWAAVPGLVCLVRAYHARKFSLIAFYLAIAAVSFFIVYRMQSRGSVFGSVAALLFAILVSSKMRRYALPFAVLALILILTLDSPAAVSNRVVKYLERGQSKEEFISMTGRTRAYNHGLAEFQNAPIFGRGQWADRLTIGEHVHNSFLQALMNGGILGGIPYFGSWIFGWVLFFKLQKRRAAFLPEDRVHLLECGAVMMFFTVRAIPETTTASFAVDLLVMVAVYVYLEALWISKTRTPQRQLVPLPSGIFNRDEIAAFRSAR